MDAIIARHIVVVIQLEQFLKIQAAAALQLLQVIVKQAQILLAVIAPGPMVKTKGFTLIELLVVLGIIVIFSGLSLAYFNTFSNTKDLEKELNKLQDTLQLAQKNAISGDSCSNYTGYEMDIISTGYTLYKCCGTCAQAANKQVSYSFPSGTSITSGTGNILFKVLGGGTDLTSVKNIHIKGAYVSPSSTQCMNVSVQPNGLVSSSNTLIACP